MLRRSRTKSFDPKIQKSKKENLFLIPPDRRARCRGTIRFFFNWQRGRHAATLWSTCTRTTSITGRKRKWPSTIKSRTPGSSGPFTTGCRIGCTKVSSPSSRILSFIYLNLLNVRWWHVWIKDSRIGWKMLFARVVSVWRINTFDKTSVFALDREIF